MAHSDDDARCGAGPTQCREPAPTHSRLAIRSPLWSTVYITVIQIVTMLATDMYMPALPMIVIDFTTSEFLANLTIVVFLLFSIIGFLVFGSLSDRFGRKPILMICSIAYTLSSIVCAASTNITVFIAARIFQAITSGALMVIGTALVKDCFPENRRMDVLLIVQGSKIIGPVIAPVIGSQILLFFSWRVTFVALSVLGVLCILMTCAYRESLSKEQRIKASVIKTFAQLAAVMRNKSFTTFLLITAFFSATPFFAYLTTSPFIYQTFFGCTAQEYSYFFAATAAVSTVGLLLYKYFSRFVSQKNITTTLILCVIVSGIGLLTMGKSSAIWFFVMILLFAIADTLTQPFRTKHLLEAQEHDAGSASAMMSCVEYAFGCFGALMLISLTQDYIFGLGILMFAGAAIALLLWIYFLRVGLTIKGLND